MHIKNNTVKRSFHSKELTRFPQLQNDQVNRHGIIDKKYFEQQNGKEEEEEMKQQQQRQRKRSSRRIIRQRDDNILSSSSLLIASTNYFSDSSSSSCYSESSSLYNRFIDIDIDTATAANSIGRSHSPMNATIATATTTATTTTNDRHYPFASSNKSNSQTGGSQQRQQQQSSRVPELNSIPYVHAGYASSVPIFIENEVWMSILAKLMPFHYEELITLISSSTSSQSQPSSSSSFYSASSKTYTTSTMNHINGIEEEAKQSISSPNSNRGLPPNGILSASVILKLIKWAEHNPIVTAFGVLQGDKHKYEEEIPTKKENKSRKVQNHKKGDDEQKFHDSETDEEEVKKIQINFPLPNLTPIEWDIFLDPGIVHDVDVAIQKCSDIRNKITLINNTEKVKEAETKIVSMKRQTIIVEQEEVYYLRERKIKTEKDVLEKEEKRLQHNLNEKVERLVSHGMVLAHGSTSQLILEALGIAQAYNFSSMVSTSNISGTSTVTDVKTTTVDTTGASESTVNPKRLLRSTQKKAIKKSQSSLTGGGIYVEEWLSLFSMAIQLAVANSENDFLKNSKHSERIKTKQKNHTASDDNGIPNQVFSSQQISSKVSKESVETSKSQKFSYDELMVLENNTNSLMGSPPELDSPNEDTKNENSSFCSDRLSTMFSNCGLFLSCQANYHHATRTDEIDDHYAMLNANQVNTKNRRKDRLIEHRKNSKLNLPVESLRGQHKHYSIRSNIASLHKTRCSNPSQSMKYSNSSAASTPSQSFRNLTDCYPKEINQHGKKKNRKKHISSCSKIKKDLKIIREVLSRLKNIHGEVDASESARLREQQQKNQNSSSPLSSKSSSSSCSISVVLDLKSRHVPPRVWSKLIDHLKFSIGLNVTGIGSFDVEELRSIIQHCQQPASVIPIIFFHSIGDLQRACHSDEIQDGDTVLFNAGSLLWQRPTFAATDIMECCGPGTPDLECFDKESTCNSYKIAKQSFYCNACRKRYSINPFAYPRYYTEDNLVSSPSNLCASPKVACYDHDEISTIQDYKKEYNLNIGSYIQEFSVCPEALFTLINFVNTNPEIMNFGMAYGGLNGLAINGVHGDGLWNQRYLSRNWDVNIGPKDTLLLTLPEDNKIVREAKVVVSEMDYQTNVINAQKLFK